MSIVAFKGRWWKGLRNFAVLNVCLVLPLVWIGLGWMPDQVKVAWRGEEEAPVALASGGEVLHGEDVGRWRGGRVWRFYLREGMAWEDLAFRLAEGKGAGDVEEVELQKWKVLKFGKKGAGLEPVEGMENGWRFGNPRFECVGFASKKVAVGFVGLEAVLLGLAWWFAKRNRGERWRTLLWPTVSVAGVIALLFHIALPLQMYLGNTSNFPFGPRELFMAMLGRSVLTLALATVALGCLVRCFGRFPLGMALAFAMCAFLESGVLSIGLPDLNGKWDFFRNHARAAWDACAWLAVFGGMAVLHPVVRRYYSWVALGLAIMVAASMCDVHAEKTVDQADLFIHDFSSKGVVAHNVVYSAKRNVLVFIIDSLECAQAHAIMEDAVAGEELRRAFGGFTEYTNNIGTGDHSSVAVANLLTGRYPESADGILDYFSSIYSRDSVVAEYLDAGFAVFLTQEDRNYTNRKEAAAVPEAMEKLPAMNRPLKDGQGWSMDKINRFRWMPFATKFPCLYLMQAKMPAKESLAVEWGLYPVLRDAPVSTDESGTFLCVHTEGVHIPVTRNRHGEQLPHADNSDAGCIEMGVFIMGELGKLFDSYREKGIYDDALILVLADHGQHESLGRSKSGEDGALPGTARPFLWVKPPGSRHEFQTSGIPTSHSRVAGLLRAARQGTLGEGEIQALLREDFRLFRIIYAFDYKKEDWIVGPDGQVQAHSIDSVDGMGGDDMPPLEMGHQYSLKFASRADYAGKIHSSHLLGRGENLSWWPYQDDMELAFRVPDTNHHYSVRMGLGIWSPDPESEQGASLCFRPNDGNPQSWKRGPSKFEEGELVFSGLAPDREGRIRIFGERKNGFLAFVDFNSVQVDVDDESAVTSE